MAVFQKILGKTRLFNLKILLLSLYCCIILQLNSMCDYFLIVLILKKRQRLYIKYIASHRIDGPEKSRLSLGPVFASRRRQIVGLANFFHSISRTGISSNYYIHNLLTIYRNITRKILLL